MKICLINNLYKPYNRGGAERVVELIARGLINAGHDVFIISTRPISTKFKVQSSKFKVYYIPALYYNLDKLPKLFRIFWHIVDMFDIGSYLKIRSILKKEKPDIAMTHNLKGVSYLIPGLIKKLNIKHIHTLHDIQLLHPSGLMLYGKEKIIVSLPAKIYAAVCRRLFNSPYAVISPSNWLMEMHADRGFFRNSKQAVMPNPVPLAIQPSHTEEAKIFRFIYVGQIEEHKGVLFLISAFLDALDTRCLARHRVSLIIAGSGSKLKQAKELAGGDKNISILGKISNEEVQKIMRQSNALIAPSLCYENSPAVIYEAFSHGLPVIASNIGGIPELLIDNAGLLFKPGGEEDLILKIQFAINNPEELRKIGERGRKKVKQFGVENYIEKLLLTPPHPSS
ncbi:glycosyltransferase family 4 protein [Patescibacteria group bacterium]|nr:glycosyltransferase family 4 protein [Patescibacteria group bacterium]MBU4455154.1 glycosyltransferase family 4 protein [Patescibacteria group bacterium]